MDDLASLPELDESIVGRVCEVIAQALGRQPETVRGDARLVADLGVDSLDLLDVVFSLEQEFTIEITRGALEQAARGAMSEDEFAPGGVIGEVGLARLRTLLPEVAAHIAPGLRPSEIVRLFTPRTFARIVTVQRARSAS